MTTHVSFESEMFLWSNNFFQDAKYQIFTLQHQGFFVFHMFVEIVLYLTASLNVLTARLRDVFAPMTKGNRESLVVAVIRVSLGRSFCCSIMFYSRSEVLNGGSWILIHGVDLESEVGNILLERSIYVTEGKPTYFHILSNGKHGQRPIVHKLRYEKTTPHRMLAPKEQELWSIHEQSFLFFANVEGCCDDNK